MALQSEIKSLILKHGKDKVRALILLRPVHRFLGIGFTTSSDTPVPILCKVTEDRYNVEEGYKIGWEPIKEYEGFSKETFYQSDFDGLVKRSQIKVYVEV